ncbi:MAG: amidase, partial [Gammaproteobacteria bacterium]|nr:amidase [Gammaproteobacteria bacterium]
MANFPRDLNAPDATALLQQLRSGTLIAEQLTTQHLQRLHESQADVNGATHILHEQAITRARELDASGDKSLPLFGLPCSIKETFGLAGEQVTAGSIRMKPEQHQQHSEIVQRLVDAGAVVMARSNVPEFAMTGESTNLRFGRTNNPLDTSRVAGGSSGGEGALVGSGACVFGVGSDILGSIRIPAAFCGTVGFKPHSGGVDKTGTWPTVNGNSKTWLALGPLTRSVRDAQLVYNVISDEPIADADISGRLVTPRNFPLRFLQPQVETALQVARESVLEAGLVEESPEFTDIPRLFKNMPKLI